MKKTKFKRDAKEKILETATQLFNSRGVNNVGIDEIIKRSGVAKMSLYNHFKSKDELIVAFLERISQQWIQWLKKRVLKLAIRPEHRLLVFFDVLEEWFKTPDFRGCPFINTTAEISDIKHPAYKKALTVKQGLLDYIRELVEAAGLSGSKDISNQILLLTDGAIIRAAMTRKSEPARIAKQACATLLRQAKLRRKSEHS